MNKDEFVKVVNALIDVRVKKIVSSIIEKELKQFKQQLTKELLEGTEDDNNIELPDMSSMLSEDAIISRPKPIPASKPDVKITKKFSNDPKINAILQQTAAESRKNPLAANDEYMSQYKQLLEEEYRNMNDDETLNFNTSNMSDIVSRRAITPEIEKKVALEAGKREIEKVTGNAELGGIIMKDYRSLLKTVDERVKSKRGA